MKLRADCLCGVSVPIIQPTCYKCGGGDRLEVKCDEEPINYSLTNTELFHQLVDEDFSDFNMNMFDELPDLTLTPFDWTQHFDHSSPKEAVGVEEMVTHDQNEFEENLSNVYLEPRTPLDQISTSSISSYQHELPYLEPRTPLDQISTSSLSSYQHEFKERLNNNTIPYLEPRTPLDQVSTSSLPSYQDSISTTYQDLCEEPEETYADFVEELNNIENQVIEHVFRIVVPTSCMEKLMMEYEMKNIYVYPFHCEFVQDNNNYNLHIIKCLTKTIPYMCRVKMARHPKDPRKRNYSTRKIKDVRDLIHLILHIQTRYIGESKHYNHSYNFTFNDRLSRAKFIQSWNKSLWCKIIKEKWGWL